MSVGGWFTDLITLQKPGTTDASAAAGAAADLQLQQRNQQLAASGALTQTQIDQMAQDWSTTADTSVGASTSALESGFVEGATDGLNAELALPGEALSAVGGAASQLVGGVGDAASSVLWKFIKAIPWWVWLGAAVFAFFLSPLPEIMLAGAFAGKRKK